MNKTAVICGAPGTSCMQVTIEGERARLGMPQGRPCWHGYSRKSAFRVSFRRVAGRARKGATDCRRRA
jgi:hypothetical protein